MIESRAEIVDTVSNGAGPSLRYALADLDVEDNVAGTLIIITNKAEWLSLGEYEDVSLKLLNVVVGSL